MSIQLTMKVEALERQVIALEQRLAAAEEWISALKERGFELPIADGRRKPGPKPRAVANG
ncbi:hypothetical protein F0160_22640 [Paraburkholderia sp. JPY303]|uniref:hypothetical protein n=1 Tax=Paraburkholderia atlantica TaxID=2654982 RepID=UPI00158FBBCA|nr:hypothetical protein [Paraburkholderia atlantica]NUY33286.1 hypothetical protein [Paraburkholderia atlantica]